MTRSVMGIVAVSACLLSQSLSSAQEPYVAYDIEDDVCDCEQPVAETVRYVPAPILYDDPDLRGSIHGDSIYYRPVYYGPMYDGPVTIRSRYRPVLGGVVTRLRYVSYGNAPPTYFPAWYW